MAVKTVQVVVNGQTYNLTLNSSTGKYEATITAPNKSSYQLDGHYYPVTVSASDTAGNSVTKTVNDATLGSSLQLRVKESTAPVIAVTSPTSGSLIGSNKPTFKWTITDDDSGVNPNSIAITIDNSKITTGITKTATSTGYSCEYVPASALADGNHTIKFDASDNDGNAATQKSITIKVDTIAPELNVTSPAEGSVTNVAECVVSGVSNDATSSPASLKVNGKTVTINADGSFSTTITLTEGVNTITIVATDDAGKMTTVTRTVTLDTKAPSISAVVIAPNPVDAGATYVVTVTVTD